MASSSVLKNDIVISTRIRLARNVEGLVSPNYMNEVSGGEGKRFAERVYEVVSEVGEFELMYMSGISDLYCRALTDRHFISSALVRNKVAGAVIMNEEEGLSVMVNEEDHLRLQCILEGMRLSEAYEKLNVIDDVLIGNLNIAYDRRYGFVTSCLTNIGTGMRASAMLFLPALTIMGYIDENAKLLGSRGFEMRGTYGEGSETVGFMYQVSNRISIGKTEKEIISDVEDAVDTLVIAEENARTELLKGSVAELKDTIMRSLGVMKFAYMMSEDEFIKRFCYVKLGIALGFVSVADLRGFDKLPDESRDAPLLMMTDRDMTEKELMIFRAEFVKNRLKSVLT